MSLTPPAGLEENDFDAIEDAVMETARGRWFLREYGRRVRAADTSRLMDSLVRIEGLLAGREPAIESVALDFEEHARNLEERHGRLTEIAWMLRERGYDGDICAMIEKEARAVGRLVRTMRGGGVAEAPGCLASPVEPEPLAIAPPAEPEPVSAPIAVVEQGAPPDLPSVLASATVEEPRDWRGAAAAALAPIDRMSTRERLALFA